MAADVRVENHGSLFLLRPLNQDVADWFAETAPEDAQFFGAALAVEPRYVEGVVEALQNDGFTCE